MVDVLQAFWLGLVTAVATGFGVFPVYWTSVGKRGLGVLWGVSAGVMASISVLDLLAPARNEPLPLGLGSLAGVVFVLAAAKWIHHANGADEATPAEGNPDHAHAGDHADDADDHAHKHGEEEGTPLAGESHGHAIKLSSLSLLMFLVFTVHSAPEGVGIGSALRADAAAGLVVVGAIALHNVPEGTAVAVGLRADGVSVWRAFLAAVVTSLPQPLLAPIVFWVAVGPALPAGMGFAGGAMLTLVAVEIVPEGWRTHRAGFVAGSIVGLGIGVLVNVLVPVPGGI